MRKGRELFESIPIMNLNRYIDHSDDLRISGEFIMWSDDNNDDYTGYHDVLDNMKPTTKL